MGLRTGNLERLDFLRLHSKPGGERRECIGVRLRHLAALDARDLFRADPIEVLTPKPALQAQASKRAAKARVLLDGALL